MPFSVTADGQGKLVLEIRPHGLGIGLWLHVAGASLLVLAWYWNLAARSRGLNRSL